MKIAILGAGFTGLAAAYRLLQDGHQVTIFEKESDVGGLAIGFKEPNWEWSLEKGYHHWFTSDDSILKLAKDINHKVLTVRPSTDVFIAGKRLPFDSISSLLAFPNLNILDKLRVGFSLLFLKLSNNYKKFESQKALEWIRRYMGKNITDIIWEPLFKGKFGDYKEEISLVWFWARIKKRTPSLAYPEGGYKNFANHITDKIKSLGGEILLNTQITAIETKEKLVIVKTAGGRFDFDKVIVTLPTPIFSKITNLPKDYKNRINSIPHLHAQVLILALKEKFMDKTYWLNITDESFPFLVLAEHTNFMNPSHYDNQHLIYIGNYLPSNHQFLNMTKQQLLKHFLPYLKKINPKFSIINSYLFVGPFAQPIVTTNYSKQIPHFKTPIKNVYLANLDMVFPWDRGTNYAVEMGEKVAEIATTDA